jgi:hypothetical protein
MSQDESASLDAVLGDAGRAVRLVEHNIGARRGGPHMVAAARRRGETDFSRWRARAEPLPLSHIIRALLPEGSADSEAAQHNLRLIRGARFARCRAAMSGAGVSRPKTVRPRSFFQKKIEVEVPTTRRARSAKQPTQKGCAMMMTNDAAADSCCAAETACDPAEAGPRTC